MNLQPLTSASTKTDEINLLKKIAELTPINTYLHDLLTQRFIQWTEEQLKQDVAPDVIATFKYLQDCAQRAESESIKRQTTIDNLTRQIARETTAHEIQVNNLEKEMK